MATNYTFSLETLGIEPPYSIQAEQSVLGAALLDPSCVDTIIQKLRPEMFYVRQNRAVFIEILTLVTNSVPVDVVVLINRLCDGDVFPAAADVKSYLAELADTVPSLTNLPHYIDIVNEKYVKRQLMEQARDVLEQVGEDVESKVMLEAAEQRLYEIRAGRDTSDAQLLKYAMLEVLSHLQHLEGPDRDAYMGIPSGFPSVDAKLTGLGRSDLIILASRPGMGKTSFALNIALNVSKQQIPVIIFSLEMTKDQLAARILSSEALVDSRMFRTGVRNPSDWDDLINVSNLLGPLQMYMDDTSAITIPEMKSKIRRINRSAIAAGTKPVGLVIIDYLQLMSSGKRSENRVQEVSEMTRNLKIMAKDLNVPIMALSQLSRNAERGTKGDHRPMLSDLRDSGSIEQDADIVMFLYRDAYYSDDMDVDPEAAECIIAKNRHGETATVNLRWDGEHTRYVEPEMYREP